MTDARCPVCGRAYAIPEGRGRAIIETRFLHHKDSCSLPRLGEIVRVDASLAVVDEVDADSGDFPVLTVHYASGRERVLPAGEVGRVRDQDAARERFLG